jgi:spore coat protein U-like protein
MPVNARTTYFAAAVLVLGGCVSPRVVRAQSTSCSVSDTAVIFGTYDPTSSTPLDSTGSVAVTCSASSASYTIALSAGQGSFASRELSSGAHLLAYNLYTDALRSMVWGDGSGATSTASGSGTSQSFNVYGRVPALQNAYVGSYADTIVVTVNF